MKEVNRNPYLAEFMNTEEGQRACEWMKGWEFHFCPECNGSGGLPYGLFNCKVCRGSGRVGLHCKWYRSELTES